VGKPPALPTDPEAGAGGAPWNGVKFGVLDEEPEGMTGAQMMRMMVMMQIITRNFHGVLHVEEQGGQLDHCC